MVNTTDTVVTSAAAPGADYCDRITLTHGHHSRTHGSDGSGIFVPKDHRQPWKNLDLAIQHVNVTVAKTCTSTWTSISPGPGLGIGTSSQRKGLTVEVPAEFMAREVQICFMAEMEPARES